MNPPADGCARSRSTRRTRADGEPLAADTPGPVRCRECGNVFGRGAEAGTVCPYCMGSLHPLAGARDGPGGAPTDSDTSSGGSR